MKPIALCSQVQRLVVTRQRHLLRLHSGHSTAGREVCHAKLRGLAQVEGEGVGQDLIHVELGHAPLVDGVHALQGKPVLC